MATYVVGDIHGCFETLKLLLHKLGFEPRRDHLWLVGDLVNRGPASLQVLRWARRLQNEMGDRLVAVLGNHDLHLLAKARGLATGRRDAGLARVLEAPDAAGLLRWLRGRPLLHRSGDKVLVHAGLLPSWEVAEAEDRARAVETRLRSEGGVEELLSSCSMDETLEAEKKSLAVLTQLRTCDPKREELCRFSGPPGEAPEGCVPWFRIPERRSKDHTILFGHWAALGLCQESGVVGLDTGCSWGGSLSALAWDEDWGSRRILRQPVHPSEAPPS